MLEKLLASITLAASPTWIEEHALTTPVGQVVYECSVDTSQPDPKLTVKYLFLETTKLSDQRRERIGKELILRCIHHYEEYNTQNPTYAL